MEVLVLSGGAGSRPHATETSVRPAAYGGGLGRRPGGAR